MYTIFSCPKEFTSLFGVIQRNAINSWLKLSPKPKIILFGVENEDIKREFNDDCITFHPIDHLNEYKTPFISSIFEKAIEYSQTETLCYVNSDIILFNDFPRTIENLISKKKYFGVGKRHTIEIEKILDFSDQSKISDYYLKNSKFDSYTGSDYFIFHKKSIRDMPNFLIGRTCWDNWLMYNAAKNNLNQIDCSLDIACIHQKHDYSHIKTNTNNHYKGIEREYNLKQLGGIDKNYDIRDSKYFLKEGILKKDFSIRRLIHKLLRKTKFLYLKEITYQLLK